ncbi:hypothetical protein BGX21_003908 [Mortierella sp. AD011]|nr:hypothetical protein BGX20_005762 [Mortierella sp. AD010]KAF9404020.1 hypothetical protein BGX21_003908 [Mortierella sp. AD011]
MPTTSAISCASSGRTSTTGYCPKDPNNIRCCTYGTRKTSDGRTGTCLPTNSCSGTSVPRYFPAPSNIQYCVSGSPPSTRDNLLGLNARQSGYARTIAKVVHTYGVGACGCAIGIAAGLVESNLTVYCNYNVPGSCNLSHDVVGSDHLSVGIFQQQVPMWGSAQQCMNPASSAGLFYKALKGINGWASVPIGTAAQRVQRSAYPDIYATRASQAVSICSKAY